MLMIMSLFTLGVIRELSALMSWSVHSFFFRMLNFFVFSLISLVFHSNDGLISLDLIKSSSEQLPNASSTLRINMDDSFITPACLERTRKWASTSHETACQSTIQLVLKL